jgi:hypothetical protein
MKNIKLYITILIGLILLGVLFYYFNMKENMENIEIEEEDMGPEKDKGYEDNCDLENEYVCNQEKQEVPKHMDELKTDIDIKREIIKNKNEEKIKNWGILYQNKAGWWKDNIYGEDAIFPY